MSPKYELTWVLTNANTCVTQKDSLGVWDLSNYYFWSTFLYKQIESP